MSNCEGDPKGMLDLRPSALITKLFQLFSSQQAALMGFYHCFFNSRKRARKENSPSAGDHVTLPNTPDSKTTEEPPIYENLEENLLDPTLQFNAETFRGGLSQQDRDNAFAKAVVGFIANQKFEPNGTVLEGNQGYCYGERKTLRWDDIIGYLSLEAFKKKRISFIVDKAKLDLRKRGFVVKRLEVCLANGKAGPACYSTALNCKCLHHGIFVSWKLVVAE